MPQRWQSRQPFKETYRPPIDLRSVLQSQYTELVAAMSFLSVLPLPGKKQLFEKEERSPRPIIGATFFPLVGLLLACLLWLLVYLLAPLIPQLALAALLVVGLVILTGGLHLDGLMDSCDGLFGGHTRERKLEIMRDSRVGSFGVLGAACILLLKFALFASISEHALPLALLLTLPTARWTLILTLYSFPSARTGGLGASFRQAITSQNVVIAGIIALIIALLVGQLVGLAILVAVSITALLLGLWITNNIGGLTGDSYGAIAEVAEVAALLLLVILHL